MRKVISYIAIVGVVVIFFWQFLFRNLIPLPADDIIGLYHPFRDFYAKDYPRGIPYKNFLITDPVRQQYPWRFESVLQEKVGQLPLWNPYNFSGTPLLANQQSAALYPLNILFFLFPFQTAWGLLIVSQPLLAALFLFFYLRNLKLHPLASLLGGIAYAFSGFFVAWLTWGTLDHVALWIPLLLLCIDKVFSNQRVKTWSLVFGFSLIASLLAGHLQTFFYAACIVVAYTGIRLFQKRQKSAVWLLVAGLIALGISSVQWIPTMQLILHSARDADFILSEGWYLPWQHLVTFFVPDFFGNPTTLNYWGVWNYGELAGYVGVVALLFSFVSFFSRRDRETWFFSGILILSLVFSLPTFLAFLPLQLHIPFLATTQPTRLMVVIDFSLAVLSSFGLDYFIRNKRGILFPLVLLGLIFSFLWIFVMFHARILPPISAENISVAKHNLIFPTGIFLGSLMLLLGSLLLKRNNNIFYICITILVGLNIFDNLRFATKFTPFVNSYYIFPATKSLQFLQKQKGNFRIMETDSRILPPNFSLIYHLQSVDGYDPLYIKEYGELIAASERGKPNIAAPFGFNRIIMPQNSNSRIMDLLGVRYVLSLDSLNNPKLSKVFEEGQTKVYENSENFPRAFFVRKIETVSSDQQAINFLFDKNIDLHDFAAVYNFPQMRKDFGLGDVAIVQYTSSKVVIKTKNTSDGFLILTDTYYPTWHAFVDAHEVKIYKTDLALRGIEIPKGTHTITFSVQLF